MRREGRRETPTQDPSRGGCGCFQLPLKKWGGPELRDKQQDHAWLSGGPRGCSPAEAPGGCRRSVSFLTEDGTDGTGCSGAPGDGPLSSTRRSLLEELGGGCGLGEPPLFLGCLPEPPSLPPWPPGEFLGGSVPPPQPLASSTLLSELQEGPQSLPLGGRTRDPPCAVPRGGHRGPPGAPPPRTGSVALRSLGDGDIPGAAVPQGPPVGWAGPGSAPPLVPNLGTRGPEAGAGGWHRSSLGDSSGDTECFVSALESLEPSEPGGVPGVPHRCTPQPRAGGGMERGETPSPNGAVTRESPPATPPEAERVRGEDLGGGSWRAAPGGSGVGELRAQFQACSLRDSPPPGTPRPPRSPVAAGDVTPRGQDPPRYLHVTPRTRSRLQAAALRLNPPPSSSSSSLFDETLEMPRRPPRLRAARGVPRDLVTTSGHRVTPRDEDGEGTDSSDDTQILPGAPTSPLGATNSPGSSPTVLLAPGDHCHPQDPPGSIPPILMAPGDRCHPQDPPGSIPPILMAPGDHCHPQDPPGSIPPILMAPGDRCHPQDPPGSSPTVPLVLGGHGHPKNSPCAAGRVPEGGSGPPLGTGQPPGPPGSFSPHPPPGSPPVTPGTPISCSTRCWEEHPEDEEQGRAPTEGQSPEATRVRGGRVGAAPPRPLSDEALRRKLRALGEDPGPVTPLTRGLYLRRLEELARGHQGHSPELVAALRTGHIPDCARDELALIQQFERPDRNRRWREGVVKSSFNYLLLDPRTTQNLPLRSNHLSPVECFRTFIESIFYVGKGTRSRPYCHLSEALGQQRAGRRKGCPKVQRILEIWESGQGIVSVLCFQSCVPAEAYTREGCLVEALGLQTLTNQRKGHCYGVAASWPARRRRQLGVHMLYRAMSIFLAEGERQLRPGDIQGGT